MPEEFPVGDRIREELLDAGAKGFTRTQIRNLLGRQESGDRVARALNQLAIHEVAKCERRSTGGRDAETWFATEAAKATEVSFTDPA
jgi:predicted transcriptional regulator